MKNRSTLFVIGVLVALISLLPVAASAADRPVKQNKDYHPEAVASAGFSFVSTGVILKIKSGAVAKDGTITTRFTVTDQDGRGLDVNGVQTPGPLTIRFVAAYIPNGQTQYTAYTVSTVAATVNTNPSQVQAGTDSGGTFALVDAVTGTYDYTFKTKAPATFDATATHSIGGQVQRDLTEFGVTALQMSNDVFTFVPNGSKVLTVRDVVTESTCNQCHNPLSAHGGPRTKVAYCVMCHTPQSTNPDSLITVDLKVFIHKLHSGSSLPSVQAGTPYWLQHRGARVDFSDVEFPQDMRNCTTCHTGQTTQVDNWKTKPSRAACGSCHDNVNFATGANHNNLPQVDDNQCTTCHSSQPTLDFDLSIPGAHQLPNKSASLPGVMLKIVRIDNATPGNAPLVTFTVKDKAGNPVDISQLTQIRVVMNGNNVDYGVTPGGMSRISEDPSKTAGAGGQYSYQMTNKIPANASGSYTISLEARNNVTLLPGTMKQTTASDNAMPVEFYFSVDKSPMTPRRQVVATAKCAGCHGDLTFVHGGVRGNSQECSICHNPTLTDGTSKQSVSMATQIHSIHRGENLTNPYVLGTTNYQKVRFPGDLRDCTTCHVNNSYQVDKVGAVANVATPDKLTPTTGPIAAACEGCHDDRPTAIHALVNTSQFGESCQTCHGMGAQFAVDTVHARN